VEPLAPVENKAGENRYSPKNRGPYANRTAQEPCHDDGEEEARVGAKKENGSAHESEHESNARWKRVSGAA
jgi:hypothetical protein